MHRHTNARAHTYPYTHRLKEKQLRLISLIPEEEYILYYSRKAIWTVCK